MKKTRLFIYSFVFSLLVFMSYRLFSYDNSVIQVIDDNSINLKKICAELNFDYKQAISVLYGERINNYDFFDKFDFVRANLGFDASIGIAQIKVSTAKWIENYYSSKYKLTKSVTINQLISKLKIPEINLKYAVIYLDIIQDTLNTELEINPSVNLLGSYYSRGIDYEYKKFNYHYRNEVGDSAEAYFLRLTK